MSRKALKLFVMLGVTCLAGCNSVTTPGNSNDANDNGSTTAAVNLSVDSPENAAKTALEVTGWSIAAILPVKNMQGIVEGTLPLPTCPSLEANIAANALAIVFDYGQGCKPGLYANRTLAGRVAGTSFVTLNAFELGELDVTFEGIALQGDVAGGYSTVDGITTITMTVNLVVDGGFTVSGPVTIELDPATGDYSFKKASLTFSTNDLGTWTADYFDAAVTPASSGSFRAVSGTASVTSHADTTANEPTVVDVTLAD